MLQTERHQTSKLTKFQPNLKNLENVFLNLNDCQLYWNMVWQHIYNEKLIKIIKVKEGGESVLIYTQCASLKHIHLVPTLFANLLGPIVIPIASQWLNYKDKTPWLN